MLGLGKLISGTEYRDAVHVAVAPVTAAHSTLMPGQHIGMTPAGLASHSAVKMGLVKSIGIVDPFLTVPVNQGERFFMFLYPNTVASLRHTWAHPAFEDKSADESHPSVSYLKAVCLVYGMDYEDIMRIPPSEWCKNTDNELPYDFWDHYEAVKGVVVSEDDRYIRCSC